MRRSPPRSGSFCKEPGRSPTEAGLHTIVLTKSGRNISCPAGSTVLEAAQQAGLQGLPYSCQGGTCRTCAVQAKGAMETDQMLALTPGEIRAGLRLPCVAYPLGDCSFEL